MNPDDRLVPGASKCFIFFWLIAWLMTLAAVSAAAQNTGSQGGGQPFDNRQPSLAINYIICWSGVFPSQTAGVVNLTAPYIGEIRAVAFNSLVPGGFLACQGQTLAISQYNNLYQVLSNSYGGNGVNTFQLPDLRGATVVGAGLPDYILGTAYGIEQETLALTNLPAHTHTTPDGPTGSTGSGQAFNNLQPCLVVTFCICTNAQIMMFTGNFQPHGWVPCNGALYGISANSGLFALIGITYGGDGRVTFAVPDLRGWAPIGYGQSPGFSNYVEGAASGSSTQTLSVAQLPSHSHSMPGGQTGLAGSGASFDNRQPTLALAWAICTNGNYPSNTSITSVFPMTGELRLLASAQSTVAGFALANGASLSIASNETLFGLLGTAYGGDGTNTFFLPDLRSHLAVGCGQGAQTSDYSLGATAGQELMSLSTNSMPAHEHELPAIFALQPPSGSTLTNDSSVNFGNIVLGGNPVTETFMLENEGGFTLTITNINLEGPDAGDFSINSIQTNLSGQTSTNLSLQFAPTGQGVRTASLYITNSDPGNDPFIVNLTGTATVSPPSLEASYVKSNQSLQFSFSNSPYASFTVLSATNLTLPASNWSVVGTATNFDGDFEFSVPIVTNGPARYYQVLSP
jgi:microcystin-dependent protein